MQIKIACPLTTARILKGAGRTLADVERFDPECWEWRGALSGQGYANVRASALIRSELSKVWGGPVPKWLFGHRVAAGVLTPDFKPWGGRLTGRLACHTCDNRRCVNPHHLRVGSYRDNKLDEIAKANGGHHALMSLTGEDVAAIERAGERMTQRAIAERYDLPISIVGRILGPSDWTLPNIPGWVGKPPLDRFNGPIEIVAR